MEINIEQAKSDYPNGYSDYLATNPTGTPERWAKALRGAEETMHNGFLFNEQEFANMDKWEVEKFWTFITIIKSEQN
jgi:hypothetical protein